MNEQTNGFEICDRPRRKPAERDHVPEPRHKTELLAGLYGIYLRQQGYSPAEAAAIVIRRYPSTRPKLEKLTRPEPYDPLRHVG